MECPCCGSVGGQLQLVAAPALCECGTKGADGLAILSIDRPSLIRTERDIAVDVRGAQSTCSQTEGNDLILLFVQGMDEDIGSYRKEEEKRKNATGRNQGRAGNAILGRRRIAPAVTRCDLQVLALAVWVFFVRFQLGS